MADREDGATRSMDSGPPEDTRIAFRIAGGDTAALKGFYSRYAELLFAFIFHQTGGRQEDSEDIWQETLLSAVRAIGDFRGQSALYTWLCGIARRKVADHFRKLRKSEPVGFSQIPRGVFDRLADPGIGPEEALQKEDIRFRVLEALDSLPEEYRIALTARYREGKSVTQLALKLRKSYKATESLLSRAKVAFRKAMAIAREEYRHDGEEQGG